MSDNASQPDPPASDSTQPYPDLAPRKAVKASPNTTIPCRIHHHAGLLACGRRRDRMAHHVPFPKTGANRSKSSSNAANCVAWSPHRALNSASTWVQWIWSSRSHRHCPCPRDCSGWGARPQGRGSLACTVLPITREQIIGTAASIECMRSGDIETLTIPCTPLDVLAQQTVAAAAMDDLKPDDWYVTRAQGRAHSKISTEPCSML